MIAQMVGDHQHRGPVKPHIGGDMIDEAIHLALKSWSDVVDRE
jgi:hypothetical protein